MPLVAVGICICLSGIPKIPKCETEGACLGSAYPSVFPEVSCHLQLRSAVLVLAKTLLQTFTPPHPQYNPVVFHVHPTAKVGLVEGMKVYPKNSIFPPPSPPCLYCPIFGGLRQPRIRHAAG